MSTNVHPNFRFSFKPRLYFRIIKKIFFICFYRKCVLKFFRFHQIDLSKASFPDEIEYS